MLGMARKATFAVRITVAFGLRFNRGHEEMRKRPYDPTELPPLILGLGEEIPRPSKAKKKIIMTLQTKEILSSLVMANDEIRKQGIQCCASSVPPTDLVAGQDVTFEMYSWREK